MQRPCIRRIPTVLAVGASLVLAATVGWTQTQTTSTKQYEGGDKHGGIVKRANLYTNRKILPSQKAPIWERKGPTLSTAQRAAQKQRDWKLMEMPILSRKPIHH